MLKMPRLILSFCLIATYCFASNWTEIGSVSGSAQAFTTLSESQTWICTTSGRIYFYDGVTLSEQTNLAQGITLSLQGIYALDSEHVWAAGYSLSPTDGKVYFYNGTTWTNQLSLTNAGEASYLYGVYAASIDRIWACGNLAQVWNSIDGGTTWTTHYDHADNKIWYAMDGAGADSVWVAGKEPTGNNAQILHFDGSTWWTPFSEYLGGTGLLALDVEGTNDVWAIGGTNGYVVHLHDGIWEAAVPLHSTNANSYSISRNKYGETWASAYGQGMFYMQDNAWIQETNLSRYIWRLNASPWYVIVHDIFNNINVRQLFPSMQRIESGIGFSWNSIPGRTYQIEWTDDPATQNWKQADLITARGWTTYWGDIGDGTTNRPKPSEQGQRSYRVVQP